ncbi:V-type proton ATPase subunit H isoform X2 [Musca vetustissima]|uniref:V-type proton ATPase subunit H isoform X2 n=1 Tax=Musca vetustissima TaxID=27455 RepID=UPI002AB619E1|nr:V-type proton ATPase subunit H isoform X2 [Musca vetustissima]XP_061392335.1 V-type proton ATPase subunit H isoform X2 [Musca vetustissima]
MSDVADLMKMPEESIDMIAATSVLQQQAADIRTKTINWASYMQSQMISQEDYQCISALDNSKAAYLQSNPAQAVKTLLNLLSHVSKDSTIQYIMVMIDDLLQEDRSRVDIFHEYCAKRKECVWGPFLNLLNRQDGFIVNMSSRILAKLACWGHEMMPKSDLNFYLQFLKDQLTVQSNEYIQSVARCLQMMLRIDEYRFAFVSVDGISTLVRILSSRVNFQVQYQLVFCLWVLTFNPLLATKMNKFTVIPILADILNDCAKEKVTRIILGVFRNLIEKPTDAQVAKEHCIAMVQCKVLKQLSILEQRRFDDEDISADVEFLTEKLQNSVQDLSSFDEYATELRSARLEWSPVHKSAKFWRENAQRLNEKNYELLRILVHLLETSKDPIILSVACYDIGEYVRHYPRGKHVLEQLGGKQIVMQLLGHEDPNVRYEALLAVQKLMVHNWEYLGKQLEKDNETQKQGSAAISGKA